MLIRTATFFVTLGLLLVLAAPAISQTEVTSSAEAHARGLELLATGDLDGALDAFGAAARAADATAESKQQYMLVRRIVRTRAALAREEDPARWWKTAISLRNYYHSFRLYDDLLVLSREMNRRKGTPGSAMLEADALLLVGRSGEAAKLLGAVERSSLNAQGQLLLGIALGREKQVEAARQVLADLEIPEDPRPRLLCDVARLKVLCGDVPGGMATLALALEKTSPKGIEGFRDFIRKAPEFSDLPEEAGFAAVVMTESKVHESSCSSGSSCGTCPKSGSCPSSGEHEGKK
jgi:hypothetical protein